MHDKNTIMRYFTGYSIMNDQVKEKEIVILGIDPGSRITGYGILHGESRVLDYGCIRPSPKLGIYERYLFIFNGISYLIDKFHPEAIAIETQFIQKNVQSALKLGMARCAAALAGAKSGIKIFDYAPTKAKRAVVGNGSASKEQVQKMIQLLLKLPAPPEPEDAADALALALCHAHTIKKNFKLKV